MAKLPTCVSPGLSSSFIPVWNGNLVCVPGKPSMLKTVPANVPRHKSQGSDGTCQVPDTVHALDVSYLIYVSHQTKSWHHDQPPHVPMRDPRHPFFGPTLGISELDSGGVRIPTPGSAAGSGSQPPHTPPLTLLPLSR